METRSRGKNVAAMTRQHAETRTKESTRELPIVHSIDELVQLVETRSDLYVRWSKEPDAVDEAVAVIEGLNEDWGSLARGDTPGTDGSTTR
jgi:hypothetical protein